VPDDVIEHVLTLFGALQARSQPAEPTSEEARQAKAELRAEMRACDNYFPDIERAAAAALAAVGHSGGAVADVRHRPRPGPSPASISVRSTTSSTATPPDHPGNDAWVIGVRH